MVPGIWTAKTGQNGTLHTFFLPHATMMLPLSSLHCCKWGGLNPHRSFVLPWKPHTMWWQLIPKHQWAPCPLTHLWNTPMVHQKLQNCYSHQITVNEISHWSLCRWLYSRYSCLPIGTQSCCKCSYAWNSQCISTNSQSQDNPISEQKLQKSEGQWSNVKDILVMMFDSAAKTIWLSAEKWDVLITSLQKWICIGSCRGGIFNMHSIQSLQERASSHHSFPYWPWNLGLSTFIITIR